MKLSKRIMILSVTLSTATSLQYAHAEELSGTLQKIKETGVVTIGVRESSPPFNYSVGRGKYVGYSYEIEMKIFDAIKQKLGMQDLKYRLLPFTSQNRIALVRNGTMAYECSSTTHNTERAKQITFTNSIFAIGTRLLTKKDSGIKDFEDLKGKNVVTIAGSTDEAILNKLNGSGLGTHIISVPDNSRSFLTLQQGRAVAYMMDDAVLYGARASAPDPSQYEVVGTPQSYEAYACMLQKGDSQMQELANGVITSMAKSGELAKLYSTWFEKPVPPHNVSLNFPMSDTVKKLFAEPNDTPFQ